MADRPVLRSCAELIELYGTGQDSSAEDMQFMLGTSQVMELNHLIQGMVRDPLEDMPIKGVIPGPDEFDLAALPDDDVLVDEWAPSLYEFKVGAGETLNCIHVVTRERFTVMDIRGMAEGKQGARARVWDGSRETVPGPNLPGHSPTWSPPKTRTSFWSPPEIHPSLLRGPVAELVRQCWVRGWQAGHRQDPRWLFASKAVRTEREARMHSHILMYGSGTGEPNVLLPGCSWCSQPTGCFCDGDEHYKCGRALCTLCDNIFATCRACTCWCGLPDRVPLVGEPLEPDWEALRSRFAASAQP
jgi:hypothetical protein